MALQFASIMTLSRVMRGVTLTMTEMEVISWKAEKSIIEMPYRIDAEDEYQAWAFIHWLRGNHYKAAIVGDRTIVSDNKYLAKNFQEMTV